MPHPSSSSLAERVRRLAEFLTASDALRVRIERLDDEIELVRGRSVVAAAGTPAPADQAAADGPPLRLDAIKAELVGIFRLGRPAPAEGEWLEGDRELAYIEALGIRNPVHSLGSGRVMSIEIVDGAAVEYGQPLFLMDRG